LSHLDSLQSHFRDAVVQGNAAAIAPVLIGGRQPEKRLSVHQRNYETSLTDALLTKFPATGWLLGTTPLTESVTRFIKEHPPVAPCIAEYGEKFPEFLGNHAGFGNAPYIPEFAQLEWFVGKAAIAVDNTPLDNAALSDIEPEFLADAPITLQSGLYYLHATWPIDELMMIYLSGATPDRFAMEPKDTYIEIRGARGEFQLNRMEPAEFIFRKSLSEGHSLGDAAECALDQNHGFDPGRALAALVGSGLLTGIR
jgi:hypothetical protein